MKQARDYALVLPPVTMPVADHASENLEHIADSLDIAAILSKPTTPQRLPAAVTAVHTGSAPPALPVSTPLSGLLTGMRLLLVEDNQINQDVASCILLHAGARVTVAADGRIALDLLRAAPEQFDAVLMDVHMPVMNGYEATRAIRAMGLSDLPIIAMTANVMDEDRSRAISSGMNACVAKPIEVDDLIGTLRRLAWPATKQPLQNPSGIPRNMPGIDLKAALHRFDGDYGVFIGLLKRFENSQGDTVAQTRGLLAGGKRHSAAQLLHRMCGVAANLGASQIASLGAQAERAVKQGRDRDLAPLLQRLDEAMSLVIATVRTLPLAPPASTSTSTSGDLPQALAQLLLQIRDNNLTALASFQSLRPALERRDRATALAMADAIETLNFSDAEKLLLGLLKRKDSV
ncbi:response regulator [Janthinobacterium agaricidamnosum]|uniref:Response regulator n=1 Tax=Janthinobacterium agaricidamnosum NBRC 102515 = DSM 9628 TaxID=1349767 RepID=W0V5S0_9BURK|nr:response regulator [Janthinobacterium agaricidamnosum]CDG82703.1 response regulator [Janthinobacterium agaricidamnosum NBRC 102515 = DSM 9628]